MPAEFLREEEDFEEDTLFDQAGLLTNKIKQKSEIRSSTITSMRITPMKTFALCLAFFGLGLSTAILEPTLLDLQHLAGTDIGHIFYTLSARSAGLILGSILGFLLFDRYNRQFLLFLIMLVMAILLGILPWCHNLIGYVIILIVMGTLMQMLFAGGNVLCLDLWGRQSGPFLQAIHFSLALGLFISPFLCNAILSGKAGIPASDSPHALNVNNSYALALPASTLFSVQIVPLVRHSRHPRQIDDVEFDWGNLTNPQNYTLSVMLDVNSTSDGNSSLTNTSIANVTVSSTHTVEPNSTNATISSNVLISSNGTILSNGTDLPVEMVTNVATTPETNATKSHKPKPSITDGGRLPAKKDPWNRAKPGDSVPTVATTSTSTRVPTTAASTTPKATNVTLIENNTSTTPTSLTNGTTTTVTVPNVTAEISTTRLPDNQAMSFTTNSTDTIISTINNTRTESQPTSTVPITTESISSTISVPTTEIPVPETPKTTISVPLTTTATKPDTTSTITSTTDSTTTSTTVATTTTLTTTTEKTSTDLVTTSWTKQIISNVSEDDNNNNSNSELETDITVIEDSSEESPNSTTHKKPVTFNNQTDDGQMFLADLLNKISQLGVTKVHIVYGAMAIIVLLTSVVFLSFLCHNPRELRSKQGDVGDKIHEGKFASVMTAIFFIFMMFYSGAELVFSQLYLSLVLQSSIHLLRTRGSLLISVFWGVYTFSRGTSICCTNGFRPATMLLLDFSCCIVSAVTLIVFGPQVESILWCSVAVMAIGLSSIFPYSLLWLEDYIHISNKTACAIFLGNSIVHFVLSFLYGHPISLSSTVVIYLVLACCVFALLLFGVAWRLATWRGDKYSKTNVKYQLANQVEDDDVELASGSSSSLYLLNNETSHSNSDNLYLPLKQKKNIWK